MGLEGVELARGARAELARRELERRLCASGPAFLLERVECVDSTTGERFEFCLLTSKERARLEELGCARWPLEPRDEGWLWQRGLLEGWQQGEKAVVLKARQLGITWLAAGLALWTILYTPGSKVLVVSVKESEAVKVVNRLWDMLMSLDRWLWNGGKVLKPGRGSRPSGLVELEFEDGRVSTLEGLTSTPTAGHGSTAALVVLDEFSRHPYAAETWKAVLPTTQGGGRVLVISTGNGVSSNDGGGNFFHHLWVNSESYGLRKKFLPWDLHPRRDEDWYRAHAEALPAADRGEQYPRDELEAFILTGRPYFDVEALLHYRPAPVPLRRFDFVLESATRARVRQWEHGLIGVFAEPQEGRRYAIGADTATGRGQDFSAAYVVDLADMALVAEFHGKLDADLYAAQLHFLGRMYNDAVVAVESAGGFGEAVLIPLRDGREGRPAYPRLYRHLMSSRIDLPTAKVYGFPMNLKTRPLVISQLEKAVRERSLPWLTDRLLAECSTFVHAPTNPSPRAADGANDDTVMAAAVALEMYRLYGSHPKLEERRKSRPKARYRPPYPWKQKEKVSV